MWGEIHYLQMILQISLLYDYECENTFINPLIIVEYIWLEQYIIHFLCVWNNGHNLVFGCDQATFFSARPKRPEKARVATVSSGRLRAKASAQAVEMPASATA